MLTATCPLYPGTVVHVANFPFEEDPSRGKARFAVVIANHGRTLVVRGIFARQGRGRRRMPAFPGTGLRYDGYLDRRLVTIRAHQVTALKGQTPHGFDPYGDSADAA